MMRSFRYVVFLCAVTFSSPLLARPDIAPSPPDPKPVAPRPPGPVPGSGPSHQPAKRAMPAAPADLPPIPDDPPAVPDEKSNDKTLMIGAIALVGAVYVGTRILRRNATARHESGSQG